MIYKRKKFFVVIPAYNEEKTINQVLKSVKKYGIPIVIDDGSDDSTYELAKKSRVYVIKHNKRLGYDNAIESGINFVLKKKFFDYVLTFDADGEISTDILKDIREKVLKKKYDLILFKRNKIPRISEYLFCLYTKLIYKVPDILCGVKVFSREICEEYKEIFKEKSINTGLAMEALRRKKNFSIVSINLNFRRKNARLGNSVFANFLIFRAFIKEVIKDLKHFIKN